MGFLTWDTLTGKIMILVLFLVILLALVFIIAKIEPEMRLISRMSQLKT